MRIRLFSRESAFFRMLTVLFVVMVLFVNVGWIFPTSNNFVSVLMQKLFPTWFGTKVVVHATTEPIQIDPTNIWDPVSSPPPKP